MRQIFEKMGVFLVDLMKLDRPGKGKEGIHQELIALSAEGKRQSEIIMSGKFLFCLWFSSQVFCFLFWAWPFIWQFRKGKWHSF